MSETAVRSLNVLQTCQFRRICIWAESYKGKNECAKFADRLSGDTHRLFTARFLTSVWVQIDTDYCDGIIEGARRLRHIGSVTYSKHEIHLSAPTATGIGIAPGPVWKRPKSPSTESSGGYWMRVIGPQIEGAVGVMGFRLPDGDFVGTNAETKST